MARALVVGASLAGLRVAEAIRAGGFTGELVVVGDEPHLPYNRPPLSKEALAGEISHATLEYRRRASVTDAQWRLGVGAVGADLAARTVTLADGETLSFDGLAVTTGVRARRLSLPGPAGGRHVVRTLEDAVALRAELVPSARLVVIGAGFIGCEVAATARGLGCTVDVVAPEQVPMQRPLGLELGAAMQRRHEAHGVRFHLGRLPKELLPNPDAAGRVGGLLLDDGSRLAADVVVEALGCLPNTEWLADQQPGYRLDLTDGVLTDGWMRARTNDGETLSEVVAAGDLARFPNGRYDDVPRRVEHWSIPTDTGKRAGQALAAALTGGDLPDGPPFAPLPSFWSDQYGQRLQSFGALGLADEVRVRQGDPDAEFVAEYLRHGTRVGVLGVGMMPALLALRTELMTTPS